MEEPTGESVQIGGFTIALNTNGSIQIMSDKMAILVKPLTGTSIMVYLASPGRNPRTILTDGDGLAIPEQISATKPLIPNAGFLIKFNHKAPSELVGKVGQIKQVLDFNGRDYTVQVQLEDGTFQIVDYVYSDVTSTAPNKDWPQKK